MGEVYRARDPQLLREVAIKVLPAPLSRDPDRQHRFEREARAAASLNHPNIVAVHDVGVHAGTAFIVTELLEGETLRQRIDGRPLSPRKAVDYGIQIASGLAAGHERGIVHRDIKPDNLFVTNDGRVKILDFGLARIIDPVFKDETETITVDGVAARVVGTARYMSPEQARGQRSDHRSDIFSLGVVLYEMLTGVSPFRRSTAGLTMAAILRDDPAELISSAPLPPALGRIVGHCLEKDPEQRFQNVRDLSFDLRCVSDSAWVRMAKRSPWHLSRWSVAKLLILIAIAGAAALGFLAGERFARAAAVQQSHIATVHRLTDLSGIEEFPSISADRRQVAFTARVGGHRQVFVRLVAGGSPVQITNDAVDRESSTMGTRRKRALYFSPATPGQAQGALGVFPPSAARRDV